jgi:hypothetical protein
MQCIVLALALIGATASPTLAQNALSPDPLLAGTTCGEFAGMDSAARRQALSAVEPLGGELTEADPVLVRQWADEVAATCANHPDRPLSDAAARALGGD